jgi:uncharacterized protein YoxC
VRHGAAAVLRGREILRDSHWVPYHDSDDVLQTLVARVCDVDRGVCTLSDIVSATAVKTAAAVKEVSRSVRHVERAVEHVHDAVDAGRL